MQPLPSRKKHALLAICFITVFVGFSLIAIRAFGSANDAKTQGLVAIAPFPLPPSADSLNGDSNALPDLLAGDVPEGVNPTETIIAAVETPSKITDALGNPVGGNPVDDDTTPAPDRATPQPTIAALGVGLSGPRVITIDGKPIDGSGQALPPAPIAGLTTISPFGQVPAISPAGLTPLAAYKRPFTPTPGREPVSIIIGGLGVNSALTDRAINDLPANVTLAFAAHAPGLSQLVAKARSRGHEVLIELPFESADFDSSLIGSSRTLMVTQNTSANPRNLSWLLSRAQGYFGVTNYNGDVFLARTDATAPLLDKLARSGLGFVFDGSISAPALSSLAITAKLPFASGYTLIDTVQDSSIIQSELARLSAAASSGISPIGVGFTYPETITAVKIWADDLEAQGLELAPASSALR